MPIKFLSRLCVCIVTLLTGYFTHAQTLHLILPNQANPLITEDNSANYVYINDTVPSLNKLFVFFAGTGGEPVGYRDILQTAANLGYHSIGLTYVNDTSIGDRCATEAATCQGEARAEVFYGQDFSSVINVDSVDGIRARLIDLLNYLSSTYPTENWNQFFAAPDSINWPSVCVSGHSQGAGMASIIAYWYPVGRGVFFATGGDVSAAADNVAAWMDSTSITPPARKYAFTHREDEIFWGTKIAAPVIWDTLHLYDFGQYISVDTLTTNFYGSHTFTSNVVINSTSASKYHGCVVVDNLTPLVAGVPEYLPVWKYMLTDTGAATLSTGVSAIPDILQSSIYPNPSSGIFHVPKSGGQNISTVTVSNVLGQVVYQFRPTSAPFDIDLSAVAAGVYFVTLSGNSLTKSHRVLKQ